MKNNERNIFEDLPANKFHSSVLTSFTMDLSHFDNQVLRLLQEKKVCSFNVLVDQRQLDQYIDFAIPSAHHIGKEYSVTGIFSKGAFHPKLSMFVGDKDLLLLYGSGNLTVPGLGKNHEVFSGFYANDEDKTQLPLLAEAWDYILSHCTAIDGYVRRRVGKEIVENSTLLNHKTDYSPHSYVEIDKNLSVALLYNEKDDSIFNQMVSLIPFKEVKHITVVSPYYDDDGAALIGLLKEASNAKMDVLLQQDCQLPPNRMKKDKRIRFLDFDMTERGDNKSYNGFAYSPFLHAKIFHFVTKAGEYCVVGSANATEAALGVNGKPINEEFCVLMFSPNRHFMKELGLTKKEPLELEVRAIERRKNDGKSETSFKVRIDSIDYQGGNLVTFFSNNKLKTDVALSGFDINGTCLFQKTIRLENSPLRTVVDEITAKQLLYFQFLDKEGRTVSNKQIINDVEALDRTTPSPRNREINRLLSKVESGNYDGLEIMEFVGDLFDEAANDEAQVAKASVGNSDYVHKQDNKKYDKLYIDWENEDLNSHSKSAYATTVSKLFECIEAAIKNKTQAIKEELFGEEDEGNAIESSNRDNTPTAIPITKTDSEQVIYGIERFVQRYDDLIRLRRQQVSVAKNTGNEIPYVNETDVKFFILSVFSVLDASYFKRKLYSFPEASKPEAEQQEFGLELSRIAVRSLKQMINNFTVFSIKCGGDRVSEDVKELVKGCMCYVFLAYSLVEKESHYKELGYFRQNALLCLMNLLDIYGKPDMDLLEEKLMVLADCFDGVFDPSAILRYAKKAYMEHDEEAYQKYPNYGICLKEKKTTKPLDYQ